MTRIGLAPVLAAALASPAAGQVFTTQLDFRPYGATGDTSFFGGASIAENDFNVLGVPGAPGYTFHGEARASGGFTTGPVLRAFAHLFSTNIPSEQDPGFGTRVQARATYTDHPTVTSAAVALGDPISATLTYTITGSFSPGSGAAVPTLGGPSTVQEQPQFNFGAGPTFTSTIDVFNGVPFTYRITLFASVRTQTTGPAGTMTFNSNGTADYENTMLLTALTFTDGAGVPIAATMTSEGGTAFAPVPEPSALGLAGAAVFGCVVRRRSRPRA